MNRFPLSARRPRRRDLRRALVGLVVASTLVAACGGDDDEAEPTTTPEPEPTMATTEAPPAPEPTTASTEAPPEPTTTVAEEEPLRQPLTGVVVESEDELITRPALAVKIDNADVARRNHTGLAVADIVFEEIVEDNNTRFAAVFHTNDADPIGPIRSGRSQDVDILTSFNQPLFAWSGGNAGVTQLIRDSVLTDLNWQRNVGTYQRGSGSAPHNLYSDTEQLYALTPEDHPGAPPQQFAYRGEGESFGGEPVERVDVAMRRRDVSWAWDAEEDVFARSMDGEAHVDVNYGPITAENVVVLVAEYRPSRIDARSPEAQTIGSGPLYVLSDGAVRAGRWSRAMSSTPMTMTDLTGEPIELTPGTTWVELAEYTNDPEGPISFVIGREAYVEQITAMAEAEETGDEPPPPINPAEIDLAAPDAAPTDIEIVFADDETGTDGDADADSQSASDDG